MSGELTRAERVIAFIEQYCFVPEGKLVGKPLVLDKFQKEFIFAVYDNKHLTKLAILSLAKKNGKTALIAALLLCHLVGPEALENSQIVSGARSREQAALVFNLAKKMVALNPDLAAIVRVMNSGKRLIGLPMNTEYRALAAEGSTAQGLSPVLIILDELGQVKGPQDDFVDALITAQGAHENPLQIVISTQAADDADLLSIWIDDAKTSGDPKIVCHVYEAPKGCDVLDKEGWKAANPALGIFRSLEDLAQLANQASRMPSAENTFRNYNLNQRVSTVSPFISPDVWKENIGKFNEFDADTPVYGGLDLSKVSDLTAFVLIGKVDGVWLVNSYFWCPEKGLLDRAKRDRAPYDVWVKQGYLKTTPGATIDYAFVVADILEIISGLNVQAIAFDRWKIEQFKKELDGIELPLYEFGQGFKDISPAIDTLEAELLNSRIAHLGHPVLTMCAANAVVTKDPADNRKLDKQKATGRIDGLVALAMAFGISQKTLEKQSKEIEGDAFVLLTY